jgi:hypothetical protein
MFPRSTLDGAFMFSGTPGPGQPLSSPSFRPDIIDKREIACHMSKLTYEGIVIMSSVSVETSCAEKSIDCPCAKFAQKSVRLIVYLRPFTIVLRHCS